MPQWWPLVGVEQERWSALGPGLRLTHEQGERNQAAARQRRVSPSRSRGQWVQRLERENASSATREKCYGRVKECQKRTESKEAANTEKQRSKNKATCRPLTTTRLTPEKPPPLINPQTHAETLITCQSTRQASPQISATIHPSIPDPSPSLPSTSSPSPHPPRPPSQPSSLPRLSPLRPHLHCPSRSLLRQDPPPSPSASPRFRRRPSLAQCKATWCSLQLRPCSRGPGRACTVVGGRGLTGWQVRSKFASEGGEGRCRRRRGHRRRESRAGRPRRRRGLRRLQRSRGEGQLSRERCLRYERMSSQHHLRRHWG